MRKILLASLFAAIALPAFALPAFAKDSGDAAFKLLSQYKAEQQQTNFIKLNSRIDMADAIAIDAKISELYGTPEVSRSGLKVWEVENLSGTGGKLTTIMCGPDGNGGVLISADRRGKAMRRTPKGQEKTIAQAEKASKLSKQPYARQKTTSHERD